MNLSRVMTILLVFGMSMAQNTVSGKVTDAVSGDALVGANVFAKGTTAGAATDIDGQYSFTISNGEYVLEANYLGYVAMTKKVRVFGDVTADFKLKEDLFSREVVVTAQRAKFRETPVPFTDVPVEEIETTLATQDLPNILNTVPGVYSSNSGGGAGDSRINIRGFSTENIAVMINGVPVNDMENGWVYWSNWSGLGDVTSSIQVQRGLGASKLSTASIGGTVNVITKSTDAVKKSFFKTEIGDFNTQKYAAGFSTGLMEDNTALTVYVARKTSDGWVNNTWSDDFVYFLSYGMLFDEHVINFNITGTPQRHGQRTTPHSIATYAERGFEFNSDYGYLNGKKISVRENFYHKPVFDINHVWKMSNDMTMNNVFYASIGTGGGTGELRRSVEGHSSGKFMTYTPEGLYDFDDIYALNKAQDATDGANAIIRASRNNHYWLGLISTVEMKSGNLNITGGFDGRFYRGEHYRTVENLLGATYFLDDDDASFYSFDGNGNRTAKNPQKRYVGDIIDYHNDGFVVQYGLFGQLEMVEKNLSAFVNASVNNTGYARKEFFLSPEIETTDYQNFIGWNLKAGANLNIDDEQNIYANVGIISKVPLFDAVFLNFSNTVNEDVKNETILGIDVGYGIRTSKFAMNLNGYYTNWADRYYSTSERINNVDYDFNAYEGITQQHVGIELETRYMPTKNFDVEFNMSHALNTYTDNFEITGVSEDDPNVTTTGTIYAKDLLVGDQPMTVASIGVKYQANTENGDRFYVRPRYRYTARHYAAFGVLTKFENPAEEGKNSWQIPDYGRADVSFGYTFVGGDDSFYQELSLNLNIFNALNTRYISDAQDNGTSFATFTAGGRISPLEGNHTSRSALVYYGAPRYVSFGATINF